MADTVIKSFMVALGFKFDEAGLKKFEAQIKEVEKSVKHFAVGFAALAVGVEEAIRRVGREFEQLFFLSAQIGTSATHLASMQFAFSQIGVSVNEFNAAITSINELMMDSPGMRQFISSHVPSFIAETGTAEQAVIAMAEELERLYAMPEGADKQNKITTERAFQRTMHLSNATMHQMALHGPERRKWQKEYDEWIDKLHFNEKAAAEASHKAMGALTFAWKQVSTGFSQLVTATMPAVTVVMKNFSEWLMEKGRDPKYTSWIDSITNWFEGPEKEKNIAKFKRALDQVLDAVLAVGRAAKMLVCWILELNNAIGTTGTLLTVLFGFLFLKGAIIGIGQGLAALLFAPLISGAAAAGSAVGTALGVAVRRAFLPLAALLIGWELGRMLSDAIDKHFPAGKKALDTTAQAGADFFNWITGGNKVTGLSPYAKRRAQDLPPELRPSRDPNTPGSYSGPPLGAAGGHDTLLEQLVMGMQHWWAGSGNFRPYVDFVSSVYDRLEGILLLVWDQALKGMGHKEGIFGADSGDGSGGASGGGASGGGAGGGGGGEIKGGGQAPRGKGFSYGMLKQLALDVGFQGRDAEIMAATWMGESSGNPYARNVTSREASYGLAQINARAHKGGEQAYGDPLYAARKSFELYQNRRRRGQGGFEDWSVYTTGAYLQHLGATHRAQAMPYPTREQLEATRSSGAAGAPAAGAPAAGASPDMLKHVDAVIGDSIAVGIGAALGLPNVNAGAPGGGRAGGANDAIGGTTPKQIYERVIGRVKDFAGKNVIFGAGSNPAGAGFDPQAMGYIHKTLTELHKAGAKIAILGVGAGVKDAAKINTELGKYAKEFGAPFTGELATTQRKGGVVHPSDYNKVTGQFSRSITVGGETTVNIHNHNPQHPEETAQASKRALRQVAQDHSRLTANRIGAAIG